MKNIKMIVTDLDGTLLRRDKTISENTKEILKAVRDKGVLFGIATARPIRSVKNFLPFLDYDFAIFHNGAVVMDGEELLDGFGIENPLDIINCIKESIPGCHICVEAEDVMYSSFNSEEIWPGFEYIKTEDFHELTGKIGDKIIVEAGTKEELDVISGLLPDNLYAELSENQVVMIMNNNATKINGVKIIAGRYNIALDSIVAFGDDYNDIDMLSHCGIGVAVDNALDDVKKAADQICGSNEDDGEACWIKLNALYLEGIKGYDEEAYKATKRRFDGVAKPLNGLGKLEELIARIGAIQGTADVDISDKRVLVCCGDNGVTRSGVSQSDSSVTLNIARSLVAGTASVSIMARSAGAKVDAIDMGMNECVPGTINRRIVDGCDNICEGPAMSRGAVVKGLLYGIEEVLRCKSEGVKIIATGEAGIGNTTTSAAIAAVLLNKDVREVVGRGAGLSDEGLERKINVIIEAIKKNNPNPDDVIDVLSKVGGADIVGLTGIFLGGAYYGVPIIMDGVISSVAALCAVRLCQAVSDYIIPSHMSSEMAMKYICDELNIEPMLYGGFHLGEGTGATALMPLLDMALSVYYDAARFDDIGVEQYTKQ